MDCLKRTIPVIGETAHLTKLFSCTDQQGASTLTAGNPAETSRPSSRKARDKKDSSLLKNTPEADRRKKEDKAGNSAPSSGQPPGGRGSKNANHLLGFTYGSGQPLSAGRGDGGRRSGRGGSSSTQPRRYNTSKPQKYNKDKFLQANFRFLVSDAVEVDSFLVDADRMFSWDDVVQVEMMSSTPCQCPISLDSPPVCPQITPCGHVYSFPSIMQHLVNYGGPKLRCALMDGQCCPRPSFGQLSESTLKWFLSDHLFQLLSFSTAGPGQPPVVAVFLDGRL
eukprot:gene1445-32819_t